MRQDLHPMSLRRAARRLARAAVVVALAPAALWASGDLSYPPSGVAPRVAQAAAPVTDRATVLTPEQAAAREALYQRGHLVILPDFSTARPAPQGPPAASRAAARAAPGADDTGSRPAPPRAAAAKAATPAGGGLLWRVETGGLPPSHLFGTIHVDDPRVLRLPARVRGALLSSRSFTMEVLLDEASPAAVSTAMFYRDGRTLNDVAGAQLAKRAAGLLAERGIPQRAALIMKPWAAAVTLSSPVSRGSDFLDAHLRELAAQRGLPAYGLETVTEQFTTFDDMAVADQVALLRQAVEDSSGVRAAVDELIDAYLARDLSRLQTLARSDQGGDGRLADEFMQRVVIDRNQRMLGRMEDRLREGGAFIAVGALHLAGEQGLVALLRDRGFRVTAVY